SARPAAPQQVGTQKRGPCDRRTDQPLPDRLTEKRPQESPARHQDVKRQGGVQQQQREPRAEETETGGVEPQLPALALSLWPDRLPGVPAPVAPRPAPRPPAQRRPPARSSRHSPGRSLGRDRPRPS